MAEKRLRMIGDDHGEYFHIKCEACRGDLDVEYLGTYGVPYIQVSCRECGTSEERKLMTAFWHGLEAKKPGPPQWKWKKPPTT